MKRRILAVLTALMVLATGSVTAFAASPTVGTTEAPVRTQKAATEIAAVDTPASYASSTSVSAGFSVSAVSDTTIQAAKTAVQNAILNDVASIASKLGNQTLAAAATDSGKKVTASILTIVEVKVSTAAKDANGNYVVTLNLSSVAAGDSVAVLHYTGSVWETIIPTSTANGSVTFAAASLSPFAVVKLDVTSITTSPKTGASIPVAVGVLVIGVVGAAVCGKKYFA